MTMNKELKSIFGDAIKVGKKTVPTAHLKYKGKETTFVVWTITADSPALSADDEPMYSIVSLDVDVYGKGNILDVITEIKKLMKANDWVWVEDSTEMYEDDTGLYHRTSSFEKERNL